MNPQATPMLTARNNAESAAPAGFPKGTQELLRIMAANSGWSEIGGRVIREPSPYCTGGAAIGRTQWIGKPEWARGAGTVKRITATVEKAIAGKRRLCKLQRILIEGMLAEIADMRADRQQDDEQDEPHPFDFDRERERWENDEAAIAEYESWYAQIDAREAAAQ